MTESLTGGSHHRWFMICYYFLHRTFTVVAFTILTFCAVRILVPPGFRLPVLRIIDPYLKMSIITNTPVGLPKEGRTTSSYWLQDGANPLAKQGSADNFTHQNVDIVIIGSGITGISAAYHLVQRLKTYNSSGAGDFRIVVLEARDFCKSDQGAQEQLSSRSRPLGSGATGRNGGHFIALPYDNFLSRTARSLPNAPPLEGDGVKAARLEISTLDKLRFLINEHDWATDVHLASNGHTRLFFTREEEEEDLKEYNAAKEAGVPWDGIYRVTKEEMIKNYGSSYPGVAIPAGSIWPVKLVTKLYQLALAQAADASVSLHLHTHTPVEAIDPVSTSSSTHSKMGPAQWHIRTSRGVLNTRFVIHATNAWASHLLPQYARRLEDEDGSGVNPRYGTWIAPLRGQIIATRANVSSSILTRRAFASDWMEDYWLPECISHFALS